MTEIKSQNLNQYRVIYEVEEIRGSCPIYKEGDKIVLDSVYPAEKLNKEESNEICLRVIHNMWHHLIWQGGSEEVVKHMVGITGEYRIACPMPGDPYTPCGYVIFKIKREKLK